MSALDIFQALCKFYSADHRIMQSGVLKYFQLRIDKKLVNWVASRLNLFLTDSWIFPCYAGHTFQSRLIAQ